ncbi:MAG: hypothetical protein ACRDRX_13415 [Pseudonocardiaceae bacterium]
MNTVLIALPFLVNALFMPLVVELVKERASGLALRVIRLAVRLLPSAYRDRYRAEWTAELDEMERQKISQLVSSLRILLGTPSVGRVLNFAVVGSFGDNNFRLHRWDRAGRAVPD